MSSSNERAWSSARCVAVVIALVGLSVVACQLVAGIERVEKEPGGALDAGSEGGEGEAFHDPCNHVRPPPLPESDDAQDVEIPPIYLALHAVKLIPDADDRYPGFDLDNVCTCDRRAGAAFKGESSCHPKGSDCDNDGGVDNAAVSLFKLFAPSGLSADSALNYAINKGERGILLYVTKYNGKLNDREVQVGVMITHGILDGSGCGTIENPAKRRAPPGWCGKDLWSYPAAHARPNSKEPQFIGTGYVNNGELVFESQAGELKIFFGGVVLTFGSPIGAGRLSKDGGLWKLDGVLAGRIPVKQLLAAVGNTEQGGAGLCASPFFEAAVRPALCRAVDISSSIRFDLLDPKGYCNSISSAILFTADEARVGDEHTEPDEQHCANVDASIFECPP